MDEFASGIFQPIDAVSSGISDNTITNKLSDQVDMISDTIRDNVKIEPDTCYSYLWAFMLVGIIVLILCFAISYPELGWYQELNNYSWSGNMLIMGIILAVIVLIMCYCTCVGYSYATEGNKTNILFLFVASLLVLIMWFYVFYNAKNLENAFYMGILFLFLTFLQTYFVWKSITRAGIGMILYILWAIFAVIVTWNISNTNTTA